MSDQGSVIRVEHGWYGCESGCCGMCATVHEGEREIKSAFEFTHEDDPEELTSWVRQVWPDLAKVPIEFGNLTCSW